MKIAVIALVILTLLGGGGFFYTQIYLPEQAKAEEIAKLEKLAKDALNACAEIGQTTRGFGGPGKRMEILKSYGFEPTQAERFSHWFSVFLAASDSIKESKEFADKFTSGRLDPRPKCFIDVLFTCEDIFYGTKTGDESQLSKSFVELNACL